MNILHHSSGTNCHLPVRRHDWRHHRFHHPYQGCHDVCHLGMLWDGLQTAMSGFQMGLLVGSIEPSVFTSWISWTCLLSILIDVILWSKHSEVFIVMPRPRLCMSIRSSCTATKLSPLPERHSSLGLDIYGPLSTGGAKLFWDSLCFGIFALA